jgi:error-prone DNA polymerase
MGETAKGRIEAEIIGGDFKSIQDFCQRTRLPQPVLEELALLGAFPAFAESARQAAWEIQSIVQKNGNEITFGEPASDKIDFPEIPQLEQVLNDYQYLGLTEKAHPMTFLRPSLRKVGIVASNELGKVRNGRAVRVAGLVTVVQSPPTAKGFAFLTLEDEFGFINVIIRPQVFTKFRPTIVQAGILHVRGTLQLEDGTVNVLGSVFEPLRISKEQLKTEKRFFR